MTLGHTLNDKEIEFTDVRGSTGIKEATLEVAGKTINVCIVHGLANAHKVCQEVAAGKSKYHFIEVMTCPGGCVNGGGQPIDFNAYEKVLPEGPCGHKAHHLLHTKYAKRGNFR